ncbi:ATP-binding protein [Streptomyces sp. NPDC048219]|uniref:ATP-binding protein n=1 Tax=unclassified Streptomyces TaxID=2593676 RepID=UPI003448DD3C
MERTDRTITSASGTAPAGTSARPAVTTAADARAHAEAAVRERWGGTDRGVREEDVVDLLLVVSELVTNAIRHGGGLTGFDCRTTGDGVWIAVHDNSAVIPRTVCAFPTDHHGSGYGWPLVARLTRDITVERRPEGGKTISALVPMRPAGA